MMKFSALIASLLLVPADALDIVVAGVTCDKTLPIYADTFTMTCNGASRCTLGNTATFAGTLAYNSTDATSIANNVAYITADLNFVTWTFHLLDQFQIDLCNQNLVASENNAGECPGDGSYSFSMDYALPNSKDASTWLASGWGGSGTIAMYSTETVSADSLVGYCTLPMTTAVTSSASSNYNPPSASTTTGLVIGAILLAALAGVYLVFRRRASSKRSATTDDGKSFFDDAKTHLTSKPANTVS